MSTTGKGSSYIVKQSVEQSTVINTGFRKSRFLHQASAGQTLIQLNALVTPSSAVNYSGPTPGLGGINLLNYQNNLTLKSSVRGDLMMNLAFVVSGSQTIKLLFEAAEGEIFEGIIDAEARTALTLADAKPLIVSGTLVAGQTDFNVGEPFKVGLYPSMKHGSVRVDVDRVLMYRNDGNQPPGPGISGDYYEVHAGAGLGTIIRFNSPDLVNDREVTVTSIGALVERPNQSMMAIAEALQGQIDQIVPTVAALADVPESNFQATPNNVDLKAFGDRVLQLLADLAAANAAIADSKSKATITLFKNGTFSTATGNNTISFDGSENANKISASGSQITFNETGIYMAIAQYRSTVDLWNKWVTVDANNNLKGQSAWMGSGTNFPNGHSWTMNITQPGVHNLVLFTDGGDSIALPAPGNVTYLGSANRTLSVVIVKISDI